MCKEELNVINYIKQLNEFYSTLDYKPLSSNAIAMYMLLMHIANKTGWLNEFRVANTTIMSKCKMNTPALQRARIELINHNYIKYKKGSNQNEMPRYSMVKLYFEQANKQANKQANEQADITPNITTNEQADEYNNKQNNTGQNLLNDTTLNVFFDYIYNKEADFEGISKSQRQGIIVILKKLEIYLEKQEHIKSLPTEMAKEVKIQYWVVKELYFSSYAVFLNELDKKTFAFCYLQTKRYMDEKHTEGEIISYFIKCLRNELKRN